MSDIAVCADCHLSHNGILDNAEASSVWYLWPEDVEVIDESDDLGFSWVPCEGCGSVLGGERFAYTVRNES